MVLLGKTELLVSRIGLGADHFGTAIDEKTAERILDAYLDMGGNFIDTANIYGKWVKGAGNASEKFLGRYLRSRKPSCIVATKGGHYTFDAPHRMRLSKAEIEKDLDESLMTLGLDTIDFYWLHRDDPDREIIEIIETMNGFVKAGKIRYFGASNYSASRLFEANAYAEAHGLLPFSAVSNRYSALLENPLSEGDKTLVVTKEEELAFHKTTKTPLVPYQATARGYFTKLLENRADEGLIRRYKNPENEALYRELLHFSREHGCSMQTATLVKTASLPFQVIPLTSVKRPEQLEDVRAAMLMLEKGESI